MDDVRNEPRTGVWAHRTGTRIETTKEADGWHVAVFMSSSGGRPGHVSVFTDPAQVQAKLADLEAQGYTLRPERADAEQPADDDADTWSTKKLLGALAVGVLIIVIGVLVLR